MMTGQRGFQSTNLPSHHPIGREKDSLNAKIYAKTILNLLMQAFENNTGLTVGIYGSWGAGKSSILRMIKENLEESSSEDKFIVVEFDPWRYQERDEIWLGMIRRILKTIEIKKPISLWEINYALWDRRLETNPIFWKNLGTIFLTGFAAGIIIALLSLPFLALKSFWINLAIVLSGGLAAFTLNLLGAGGKALGAVLSGKVDLKLPALVRPSFDQGTPISVDNFRDDFRTIIETVGRKKTIVVLIDDLDRCAPDQVVPLLEAIKHFGFDEPLNKGCATIAFVLAADRYFIETCIQAKYKDFLPKEQWQAQRYTHEYLEKIVQYSFILHPPSRSQMAGLLFKSISREDDHRLEENSHFIDMEIANEIVPFLAQGIAHQPRSILQAFRNFSSNWLISQELGFKLSPKLLALFGLMQDIWPNEFNFLSQYPDYFYYLHNMVSESTNVIFAESEGKELHDLGLPQSSQNPLLYAYNNTDLARLISELSIDISHLELEKLSEYILYRTHVIPPKIQSFSLKEISNSGDPVYLSFVRRTIPLAVTYISILLANTKQACEEICEKLRSDQKPDQAAIDHAELLIFAIGRIASNHKEGQFECLSTLSDLLLTNPKLPLVLQLRIVYAIGHFASQGSSDAAEILKRIIYDTSSKEDVKSRVELLFTTFTVPHSIAADIVPLIYKRVKFSSEAILTALETIKPEEWPVETIVEMCEIVAPHVDWPYHFGSYFIGVLRDSNDDGIYLRAFNLIRIHRDHGQAMHWLLELSKQSQYWVSNCYQELGRLQATCEWHGEIWLYLMENLEKRGWPDELMMKIVIALANISKDHPEAKDILRSLSKVESPSARWKNYLDSRLLDASED